ncbi:MAG: hypothetical protein ACE5HX_05915 [bacterium]
MRHKVFILLLVGLVLNLWAFSILAQEEEPKSQLYFIHEDVVKPSMVSKYEEAVKGVVAKLTENNMTSLSHVVAMSEDFHYSFIAQIENMADLDKSPWKELEKKIGEEAMKAMWKGYEGTYYKHHSFLVRLRPDLSYTPETTSEESEEMNFRHWSFYYVNPDKWNEAREISKEWVALFKSKKIPTGYRMYTGGIGTEVPLYIVVQWAKNAAEFYAQAAKNDELLGEEGEALGAKTMAITRKFEQKNGWIRPDLSYMPEEEMTAK